MRVLLVDDHELYRAGTRLAIGEISPDLQFEEAGSLAEAEALTSAAPFDLVLLDYRLPDSSGTDALERLKLQMRGGVVVVLSMEDSTQAIRKIIEAGAAGFIPKNSSRGVTLAALRLVLAGGIYLPPHALLSANDATPASATPTQLRTELTERQIEALRLVALGKSNKLIARELQISEATVKAHLAATFRALGVKNRTEAVYWAARIGARP